MGLDAYVPCNCVARGLARPPPVAITIEDGIASPTNPDADWQAFDDWSLTACPHARMEVVSERVGNWAGVRTLQDALRECGAPVATLLGALPEGNGGSVEAATCRTCLDELATFRRVFKRITWQLVDAATGERRYDYVAAYAGQFLWSRQCTIGFDRDGLFVLEPNTGQVLLRARRIRVVPVDRELAAVCDLDGTATVTCPWPHPVETSYEVIEHVETAADHEHKLAVLEGLFRAAIEHDTCVVWC